MKSSLQMRCVSTGIDWLTVTTLDRESSSFLETFSNIIIREEHQRGNIQNGWGMAGYSGWQCGQVQAGRRGEEFMVRLSGDLAQLHWGRAITLASNVTRIDLQVTFFVEGGPRPFIRKAHKHALRHAAKQVRGPSVALITNNQGGDTLYLGKRESYVYARLYNKAVESKQPEFAGCARAECEYKGKHASLVAARLMRSKTAHDDVVRSVSGFFENRGVKLELAVEPIVYRLPRSRTDLDGRLQWIQKACRASVAMAIEFGRAQDLLNALGIAITPEGTLVQVDQHEIDDTTKGEIAWQ